jgi:hypothetical protein
LFQLFLEEAPADFFHLGMFEPSLYPIASFSGYVRGQNSYCVFVDQMEESVIRGGDSSTQAYIIGDVTVLQIGYDIARVT